MSQTKIKSKGAASAESSLANAEGNLRDLIRELEVLVNSLRGRDLSGLKQGQKPILESYCEYIELQIAKAKNYKDLKDDYDLKVNACSQSLFTSERRISSEKGKCESGEIQISADKDVLQEEAEKELLDQVIPSNGWLP